MARELDPAAAHDAFREGAFLLDVREVDEWQAGHDPGAVHVPMGTVVDGHDAIPRDRTVLVICRSGARSAAVTDQLTGWGYDAVNVAGGMQAWAIDHPPVDASGAPGYVA